MATRNVYDQLKQALYPQPGIHAFAVLDGAAVPDLLGKIGTHRPQYARLLPDPRAFTLPKDAPHIVHLVLDDAFTRWVADEGWGRGWGVFALGRCSLLAFRDHCQSLLDPAEPGAEPTLPRFFDPAVLRACLRDWPAERRRRLFGPVMAYLVEDEGGRNLLAFGGYHKPQPP